MRVESKHIRELRTGDTVVWNVPSADLFRVRRAIDYEKHHTGYRYRTRYDKKTEQLTVKVE